MEEAVIAVIRGNRAEDARKETVFEQLFTIKEASEETKLSEAWWRQAVFQRKVKYLKLARRVLIPESTIRQMREKAVVEPRRMVGEDA